MVKTQRRALEIGVVVTFACFMATTILVRQDSFESSFLSHYTARTVQILVCFFIAFISRNVQLNTFRLFWIGAGCMVVYLALEYSQQVFPSELFEGHFFIFNSLAGMFDGVVLACLMLVFARVLCSFPPRHAAVMIPLAWALDHSIFLASYALPSSVLPWLKIVLSLATLPALYLISRKLLQGTSTVDYDKPRKEPLRFIPLLKENRYFSLYFGMLVFPFFYGLMAQICTFANVSSGLFDVSTEIVGIVFLVLLAVSEPLWKSKLDPESVFIILLPIFATALLFFPLFWNSEVFVSGFIMKCGFLIFNVLMWIFLQKSLYKTPDRSFFFFGIALGLSHLALMGGRLMALALNSYTVLSYQSIATASLIAIWLLSMAALIFIYVNRRKKQSEAAPLSNEGSFDRAARLFAESYALSEREFTVMKEFALGRSVGYIAQRLFVSQETVKTHLKRLYAKSDCHNRQELFDKIESFSKDVEQDDEE